MGDFPLYVKSTLDALSKALATSAGFQWFEADSVGAWAATQESKEPAVVMSLAHIAEDPMDPCYEAIVELGVQVTLDPTQRVSMKGISLVGTAFAVNGRVEVKNYTGTSAPTAVLGYGTVVEAQTEPSLAGKTSSVRMWSLRMKFVRFR